MRIEIAIPTKNREIKLLKCLGSIDLARKQIEDKLFVYVYFSIEKEYREIDFLLTKYPYIFTRLLDKEYNASEFWNNHLKDSNADIFYYINDDVILAPDCLKNSIESMNKYFPNEDGVIGLNQENIPREQQCKAAFGGIGREFINRFPKRQVFMPKYKRFFLDQELYEYSNKIGKFYFDETAKLIHMHPAFNPDWMDEIHVDVRKRLAKDKELHGDRKNRKLLWGESFDV